MGAQLPSEMIIEPERYELHAAPLYRFQHSRREFFKAMGSCLEHRSYNRFHYGYPTIYYDLHRHSYCFQWMYKF